jgi:hypothetical protein
LNPDSATNNTSLILAIELWRGGAVVPGRCAGWQLAVLAAGAVDIGRQQERDGHRPIEERTVLYKVGHHGSHNATLREHGLELMPHGLAALLPVDHEMAVKKRWDGMPLEGLLDALKAQGVTVVRMDDDHLPKDPRFRASDKQGKSFTGSLFYEWTIGV